MEKAFLIRNNRVIGFSDKACVELTQQEYDILSDEKKNDGTIYFITDGTDDEFGINDGVVSETTTWSSSKIESALQTSKNVGITDIVGTSYIDTSGVNRYCVINGICYVTLEFTVLTSGSLWDGRSFFETLLPAPKIQQDIFYDGTQRLLVGVNGTIHGDMTKDKKIYISFSYPVA